MNGKRGARLRKSRIMGGKISKRRSAIIKSTIPDVEAKYEQKLILNQLKELLSLVKRIEKRISKLEEKPDK